MRIDKLSLWRYGKFTDLELDFGKHRDDQPDLHIIYGPNEAGKSTLMAAYLDFLFGFAPSTPYNFKHANTALKIGGVLNLGDETQDVRRLKKNKNGLVDKDDQPMDDSLLLRQLSGLGKKSYQSMFSLNDDTLEEGGESILASEGDLGKLLYSATTGVAQLSESLLQMRAESELFYRKNGRKFELTDLKTKLKQIDNERKAIDIEANAYSKLVKQLDAAEVQYSELGANHSKLKLQIHKLQRMKTAFPRLSSLRRLQTEMLPLNDLPNAHTGWVDEVKQLQIDSIKVDTTEQELVKSIDAADDVIKAIALDDTALAASPQWQQIEQDRDNFMVASNNLPDHKQQLRLCDLDIEASLHKLDCSTIEQPQQLILNIATQSRLKELIKQQPDLISQLKTAKKELLTAQNHNKKNLEKFVQQGGKTDLSSGPDALNRNSAAIVDLELSIAPFTNNELNARYRATLQQRDASLNELNTKMAALRPWKGDAESLQSITTPHITELYPLLNARADIAERLSEEKHLLNSLQKKKDELRAQQNSFSATGLVDDAESQQLRKQRDDAWNTHKDALDANTADQFEQAMRADDASQASRLQHTESLAQLSQLSRDIIVNDESIANGETNLELLAKEQLSFTTQTEQLISNISPLLNSDMTIEAVGDWCNARTDAIQVARQITNFDRELMNIEEQASEACTSILKSLVSAGGTEDTSDAYSSSIARLSNLLKIANSTIKREGALEGLVDQLATGQNQLSTREIEVESAQEAVEHWNDAWAEVCASCWLGANKAIPETTNVEEVLPQLALLEQQLARQSMLVEQVAQYQSVLDTYGQLLITAAQNLSMPSANTTTDQLYQNLALRMEQAVVTQKSHITATTQKEELLAMQKSNQIQRSTIEASIASKCEHFSVKTIDDVQFKLMEAGKKHELQNRIDSEQRELLEILSVESVSDAIALFDDFDEVKTQIELDDLDREEADLNLKLREAHTTRDNARKAVENVGGDDAVAVLQEQRANLLLEIEEKISRFLQQHLALNAADAALKAYRDNHRSSMMTKASDVFARISQGRYTRLETFQDGASEQLITIDAEGGSKETRMLSKGTRFQLYLALRIAGYHEYASTRPSVPFIADDIMETSDDGRAKNTFEVLGDMASVGQVIYLTHHQHLCDIAKQAVPNCMLHELPS